MKLASEIDELEVLGVPLTHLESYSHAVSLVFGRLSRREKTFCVAINPEKICRAQGDAELHRLILESNFHICDGVGAAIAARVLHRKAVARITGVQLFLDLMKAAERDGTKVFLLGASPESNTGAVRELQERHPALQIVGHQDGYFKDSDSVVEMINESGAQMLFVAMGSPRQEKWIAEHWNRINASYCMGVGGTLDVVSGQVGWAPAAFRRTGTEFVYRLIKQPQRWPRYLIIPEFLWRVARELVSRACQAQHEKRHDHSHLQEEQRSKAA